MLKRLLYLEGIWVDSRTFQLQTEVGLHALGAWYLKVGHWWP